MKITVKVQMGATTLDMSFAEAKELQKILDQLVGPWKAITKQMDDLQEGWAPEAGDKWIPSIVWSTTEAACGMEIVHV